MTTLDDHLLEAHAQNDRAALVGLYIQAADSANDLDAACFYLTHAYVFALEQGDTRSSDLHARLISHGREA